MKLSYQRWVAGIERHHRAIVAASLALAVLSALSLVRLRLDIDVLGMLPRGEPAFDDFKSFVSDFGELDQLIVLVQGAPLPRLERFADAFAARLAALDTVAAVQSRLDVQQVTDGLLGSYLYNYLPEADYAEVARRLTPAGIAAQVAADRAILSAPFDLSAARAVQEDPLGFRRLAAAALAQSYGGVAPGLRDGYFVSADGRALLLLVRPKASAFDIDFSRRLLQQVRAAEAEARHALGDETTRIAYTGSYVYALEDAATLKWDVGRYTTLALIGVLVVFFVGYRNLRILPFVTYPLILTTLLTFALSLLLFAELNAVSISFAAILYGLSIDSGIYFYTRLLQEREKDDGDLRRAVTATLASLGRANLAASTTSAAAFLVIGLSVLVAVRQLGILTALGLLLTTVEFFVLFPALGFLLGRRGRGIAIADTPRLGRWAQRAAARAKPVAVAGLLLGAILLLAARRVGLDAALTHLRPADSAAARVQDEVAKRFGEPGAGGAVLVDRAELQQALVDSETVAARLRAYQADGLVRSVQSVAGVLPSEQVQRARLALYDALPRAAALATLRDTLQRQGFVPERFRGFFDAFARPRRELVDIDTPALAPVSFLIQHHVRKHAGRYIVATYLEPAAGVAWSAIADRLHHELPDLRFQVAARALLEENLAHVLRHELSLFFVLGLAGNVILLWLSFGELAVAAAILAPVVLVLVCLFAGMWATGVRLDPVNLIVTPLIFGIGVDYGVYIVARARERASVPEALRRAGRAVVVTSLTTIVGFGFLGLSRYPPLASMGLLAAAGLFLCLVLSIILLPALLTLARPAAATTDGENEARATK